MEKREDGMYLGKFEDPKIPRNHELFLEAKGIDEGTLRERLPRLLKIGSWTQIGYILNAAMPGVRVQIEYRPPGAIPIKPGLSTSGSTSWRLLERHPRLWHDRHLPADRSPKSGPSAHWGPGSK
jgi:predicted component of type VI protein secretion system